MGRRIPCSAWLLVALLPIVGTGCTTHGTLAVYNGGKKIDQRAVDLGAGSSYQAAYTYRQPALLPYAQVTDPYGAAVATDTYGARAISFAIPSPEGKKSSDFVLCVGTGASLVFVEKPPEK